MKLTLSKKQLRHERLMLDDLINRYGNITLYNAHDFVSVEIDLHRGAGSRKRKINISEKEYSTWMA